MADDIPLPLRVCIPCGNLYRRRPGSGIGITTNTGVCVVCGEETHTAPDYDFGGLRDEWRAHRNGTATTGAAKP